MRDRAPVRPRALAPYAVPDGRLLAPGEEGTLAIGTQASAITLLALERRRLDRCLDPLGYEVSWTRFPSGPAPIEALRDGIVDRGCSGAMPPILAVAHGAPIVTLATDEAVLAEQQRIADHFAHARRIPERLDAAALAIA